MASDAEDLHSQWYNPPSYEDVAFRYLAGASGKGEPSRSDYSIMSVSVMTLALILFVEIMRHRIDHYANGRPLFSAVLANVYQECK
jgi:hypothetical protein